MIYKLPAKGRWWVYSDDELTAMKRSGDPQQVKGAAWFEAMYHDHYQKNPLSFFLAHGGAIDFINDINTNKLCILWAGNQDGKTFAGLCKLAMRVTRNIPEWEAFTFHGLKPRKWDGPQKVMVSSYEWLHVRNNLWPKICEILPVDELREYSPKWTSAMARRKSKLVSEHNPTCKLANGSVIDFYCYRQPPEVFEGPTYDAAFYDEQPPEYVHNGVVARGQNQPGFQENVFCTPHQVKGLAYTGSGTWIHKAWESGSANGMTVGRYRIEKDDVPDAIVPKAQKALNYERLITAPLRTGNLKAIREGRSRWFGTPESSEGLVYDNWIPSIHWITPFDIPKHWTRCRAVDPGRVDPTAVLFGAVSPWGDLVLYREYYESGLGIADHCKRIIAASGNTRDKVWEGEDGNGNIAAQWEEQFTGEEYSYTVMDSRSFAQPSNETGVTLGMVWAAQGLRCRAASGMRNDPAISMVKEWFEIDPNRTHILVRMGIQPEVIAPDGNPLKGAPRIYVFNSLRKFREEIDAYVNKADKPDDPAPNQQDHAMTALKYLVLAGPRYLGPSQRMLNPVIGDTLSSIQREAKCVSKKMYEYHT